MENRIIESENGAVFLEKDGRRYLAAAAGVNSRVLKGRSTAEFKSSSGLIAGDPPSRDWKVEGIAEAAGGLYFYGPLLDAVPLSRIDMDEAAALELIEALKTAAENGYSVMAFSLATVYRLKDGGIFFLPPAVSDFIQSNSAEDLNIRQSCPYNHPDLKGPAALAFTAAAVVYGAVTGKPAFGDDSCSEIRRRIRKNDYESPLCSRPEIAPPLAGLIQRSFDGRAGLDEWIDFIERTGRGAASGSFFLRQDLAEDERMRILGKARREDARRLRRNRLSGFFRKNRAAVLITALALAVLLSFIVPVINRALEPPVTAGLSREEVIRLYYGSFNSLDFEKMEDCITSACGKEDIDLISTLTVISRARQAYEQGSVFLDAESWKKEGGGPVDAGIMVWGLSDLKIEKVSENSFNVYYEKWGIDRDDAAEDADAERTAAVPEGQFMIDKIHLSEDDGVWIIDELERIVAGNVPDKE